MPAFFGLCALNPAFGFQSRSVKNPFLTVIRTQDMIGQTKKADVFLIMVFILVDIYV